ncbi:MAG TPA: hypothetical protein VN903_11395 [Polyangia bacterium]|nr:hypothetical protein [Polyangia bacterium]
MSEPEAPVPAAVVASSYVDLTVAIVQLDERIAHLESMLGEFLKAFRQYLESLEDDDARTH